MNSLSMIRHHSGIGLGMMAVLATLITVIPENDTAGGQYADRRATLARQNAFRRARARPPGDLNDWNDSKKEPVR